MTPFQLLHISDTHLFSKPDGEQRGVITAASLAAVLKAAMSSGNADAVVVTGDLCQDESRKGYELLRSLLLPLRVPVICLPGNHDNLAHMQKALAGDAIAVLGDHTLGDWVLMTLDCTVPGEVYGELGPHRLADLEERLQRCAHKPVLIALHHPPVNCDSAWLDGTRLQDGDALLELLVRHPQVHGVLCGHIHQQLERTVTHTHGAIQVMATPSTCRQFAIRSDEYATDEQAPGWRWLTLFEQSFKSTVERLTPQQFSKVVS
ncbi:MAG: phosphodiesterase [Pseudomonadota bacterium]